MKPSHCHNAGRSVVTATRPPLTAQVILSPGPTSSASQTSFGMVVCRLLVMVERGIAGLLTKANTARELLRSAEDGEIAAIVPQSVVFEVAYVLQSQHGVTGQRLATIVDAVTSFPGVRVVDECPWKRVLEIWPARLTSLADAAIVAVAMAGRHDAVATFDRKLANRLESLGLTAHW